jgi:type I restriction enzyme S subunit
MTSPPAAKWKPYPKYKDSGVEWLGEVPEHWPVLQLRRSAEGCQNGVWGEEPLGGEDDIVCVRVADFDRIRNRVDDAALTVRAVPASERRSRLLRRGDLLLEKSRGRRHSASRYGSAA